MCCVCVYKKKVKKKTKNNGNACAIWIPPSCSPPTCSTVGLAWVGPVQRKQITVKIQTDLEPRCGNSGARSTSTQRFGFPVSPHRSPQPIICLDPDLLHASSPLAPANPAQPSLTASTRSCSLFFLPASSHLGLLPSWYISALPPKPSQPGLSWFYLQSIKCVLPSL